MRESFRFILNGMFWLILLEKEYKDKREYGGKNKNGDWKVIKGRVGGTYIGGS